MKRLLLHLCAAALLSLSAQTINAQDVSVTLTWNPSPETNLAGYRLHYGTSSHTYTQHLEVGNTTTVTVSNLSTGTVYYFAATAYDTLGIESLFSNEVQYTASAQTPTPTPGPGPTATPSATSTPSSSASPTPTATSAPTTTPAPSSTPSPTSSPGSTGTPAPTSSPGPTATPLPSSTPVPSATPGPSLTPSPTPGGSSSLANVSTRLFVETGDNAMFGGFMIAGNHPKRVILRAIGPSLTSLGVSSAMPDPALQLYDSFATLIASNEDWRYGQTQIIQETGLAPTDDHEAAIVATLAPGSYTAVVFDQSYHTGVALFELYDLDSASSRLLNLSTRGRVDTEDRVMIGGFVVGGTEPLPVIVRAIGPSLIQFGILNALLDPILELRNGEGSLVLQNDNWRSDQEQLIIDSNLAPTDNRESAVIATLTPGPYSAVVRGSANSTGVALFEIYKLAQ